MIAAATIENVPIGDAADGVSQWSLQSDWATPDDFPDLKGTATEVADATENAENLFTESSGGTKTIGLEWKAGVLENLDADYKEGMLERLNDFMKGESTTVENAPNSAAFAKAASKNALRGVGTGLMTIGAVGLGYKTAKGMYDNHNTDKSGTIRQMGHCFLFLFVTALAITFGVGAACGGASGASMVLAATTLTGIFTIVGSLGYSRILGSGDNFSGKLHDAFNASMNPQRRRLVTSERPLAATHRRLVTLERLLDEINVAKEASLQRDIRSQWDMQNKIQNEL